MKLHHLKPAEGAKKARTRVGRGRAGKGGKTAGRGSKGWGARHTPQVGFEGGQMPLIRRIPKLKGFANPGRVDYAAVNVEAIAKAIGVPAKLVPITAAERIEALNEGKVDLVAASFSKTPDRAKLDRKSTRLNSSHSQQSRMPSSA